MMTKMKALFVMVCLLSASAQAGQYPIPAGVGAALWSGLWSAASPSNLVGDSLQELTNKGFQTFKIPLDPVTAPHFQVGYLGSDPIGFLANEAATPTFAAALGNPAGTTYYLAAIDAVVEGIDGSQRHFADQSFLNANANAIFSSYYQLAYYLATTYRFSGKTFVLVNWETDNALYCGSAYGFHTDQGFRDSCLAGYQQTYGAATPADAYAAMSYWFSLRSQGIWYGMFMAQQQLPGWPFYVNVVSGIEFNTVNLVHSLGYPTALYNIIPNSGLGAVGYSSYESINQGTLLSDFATIEQQVQGRPISVTEYGFSDNQFPGGGAEQLITSATQQMVQLEQQGRLKAAVAWQSYMDSAYPQFGILYPDGSNGPLFNAMLSGLGIAP